MKITFIEHSGFSVELSHCVLLFDYYSGGIPEFPKNKDIYVFVSHSHGDHYNKDIFKLEKKYPKIHYILSDDVKTSHKEHVTFMEPHQTSAFGNIRVMTLASNDLGVAFLVEAEGKNIYHSGDLHWWHWNGEPDEDNRWMVEFYKKELERLRGVRIDVAFLVLDPRQEDKYCLGMNYFIEEMNPKHVFPMHGFGKYKITKHYLNCNDGRKYQNIVEEISGPGQETII